MPMSGFIVVLFFAFTSCWCIFSEKLHYIYKPFYMPAQFQKMGRVWDQECPFSQMFHMASRHTCAKGTVDLIFKSYTIINTHLKKDLKHLQHQQCDESNQKGPCLNRKIQEVVHLCKSLAVSLKTQITIRGFQLLLHRPAELV